MRNYMHLAKFSFTDSINKSKLWFKLCMHRIWQTTHDFNNIDCGCFLNLERSFQVGAWVKNYIHTFRNTSWNSSSVPNYSPMS